MMEATIDFIICNFDVLSANAFTDLPFATLYRILSTEDLSVKCETHVIDVLVSYFSLNQDLPNGNMCKLVDLIRCGLMQTEDLSQLRKLEQFVGKDHIGQMFKWVKI